MRRRAVERRCSRLKGRDFVVQASDVYDVRMIRKQLYIGEEHDRALKRRARELGVSEAELVRRLLDGLVLEEGGGGEITVPGTTAALVDGFFAESDRTSEAHRFPEGYGFDRDELYEERGEGGDGATV